MITSEKKVSNKPWSDINISSLDGAAEFVALIRQALLDANRPLAMALAKKAVEIYPTDQKIQKFNQVLHPPSPHSQPSSPQDRKMVIANHQWIQENRQQYYGQWVALCGGELVGHAATLQALIDDLGKDSIQGVLLTVVL